VHALVLNQMAYRWKVLPATLESTPIPRGSFKVLLRGRVGSIVMAKSLLVRKQLLLVLENGEAVRTKERLESA